MILTITPNPTLDRAMFVRGFRMGAIVRAEREVVTPSGKGVDVSLVLHALGHPTYAIGLQAGQQGRLAAQLLAERGIPHRFVWAQGETRHALVLIDMAAGSQSTISAPTLHADATHLQALTAVLDEQLPLARFAVLAGSLPPGWPDDAYVTLLARCRASQIPTLLDTSGRALAAVLRSSTGADGTIPDIIKVNAAELHEALGQGTSGRAPHSDADQAVRAAACDLRERLGNQAVIVTLGARGAVAATSQGVWRAVPPAVVALNDAGAGDALAAGIAQARSQGEGWDAALRLGSAWAAAVVTTAGTAECDPALAAELAARVVVHDWSFTIPDAGR
jgi:1-phosphofructokinase family hexose kinase